MILRTLAALSLAAAIAACGQLTGAAKDKTGEGDAAATAEGSADAAKPDEDAKPTTQEAPAGTEPDKPT